MQSEVRKSFSKLSTDGERLKKNVLLYPLSENSEEISEIGQKIVVKFMEIGKVEILSGIPQ